MKGTKRKRRLLSFMLVVGRMSAMGSVAYAADYKKAGDVSSVTGTAVYDAPVLGASNPTAVNRLTVDVISPLNQGVSVSQTA